MKSSGIGGQAVIEGVMMRNKDQYAVAVRTPDKTIDVKTGTCKSPDSRNAFCRLPFVRGVVSFVDSISLGMKTLSHSASFFEEEEEKKDKKELTEEEKKKAEAKENIVMSITVMFSIMIAIAVFVMVPFFVSEGLSKVIESARIRGLIEGVIRVLLFIGYVKAITLMDDIKRVFMYHGAEHKTINCVENGLPLTVENVKTQSKIHRRCGTSFMLIVMIISILFFFFIVVEQMWLRMVLRLLLIPVIAGIAYEFIRLAGNSDNKVVLFLSKPGFWLQGLTTREPDDSMIEVAIESVEAVFDWKKYQEELLKEEEEKALEEQKEEALEETDTEETSEEETSDDLFEDMEVVDLDDEDDEDIDILSDFEDN